MWFPNRSDTNRAEQSQKIARSLKFWSYVEEELYYPSSENKGADQLRSYCEADLRLCFRICRLLVFLWVAHFFLRIHDFFHNLGKCSLYIEKLTVPLFSTLPSGPSECL